MTNYDSILQKLNHDAEFRAAFLRDPTSSLRACGVFLDPDSCASIRDLTEKLLPPKTTAAMGNALLGLDTVEVMFQ